MEPLVIVLIVILAICLLSYFIYQNKNIGISEYGFTSGKLKNNYRIVHLSDVHNDLFGKDNINLINKVKACNPDYIMITGDLIDKRRTKYERGIYLASKLVEICPVYYVYGNHEAKKYSKQYEDEILKLGVHLIRNDKEIINDDIRLIGFDDVGFGSLKNKSVQKEHLINNLESLVNEDERFTILLSHRPQFFESYISYPVDLVLTGHAHGGQVRLPLIGGLFAPQQLLLPKYSEGVHSLNGRDMLISRGLGNSLFPLRGFNNPEIVLISLNNKK